MANIKVNWQPNLDGRSGSHFYSKYRIKGESKWQPTDNQLEEDYLIVRGLEPDSTYQFQVVAVDGEYFTESQTQEVDTYGIGKFFFTVLPLFFTKSFFLNF